MTSKFPALLHAQKTFDKLVRLLPDAEKQRPHVVHLVSEQVSYRNDTDRELSFRQESNYFYLTGCNIPGSSMLAVDYGSGIQLHLFIPREDPLETMWSPPPPTLQAATETLDAHSIKYTDDFLSTLTTIVAQCPDALIHTLPTSPLFPSLAKNFSANFGGSTTSAYLLPALHLARLIKTPYEIELIRKANAISSRAHEVIMRVLGKDAKGLILGQEEGVVMPDQWRIEKEAEAEAIFVASCRREGEFAWGPFVPQHDHNDELPHTNGTNGVNGVSKKTFIPQVLLLDAGCEWNNYASDITRTTPIGNGGKFTKEAREIYSLVLKMQNDSIDALKPRIHWDTIHLGCHKMLVKRFLELGIFKGNEDEVLRSGVSAAFFPHGLGHSLGLDVHDVPSASKPDEKFNMTIPEESRQNPEFYRYLRLRLPLEAGMVLTVEPGVYFSPHLLAPVRSSPYINQEVLAKYESVGGVRIEDVLLITANGSENLTTVGKDVDWIEKVCSGRA
ncbi:hypothetical protein FRC04_004588 [Tulasnella sp. 424]|nr:hypothetical protein FRC04_004588 [Tulasnella sp. 424]KAG8964129.1 hypothetical protein FRC05_004283 [Tulasnella sp. 425]